MTVEPATNEARKPAPQRMRPVVLRFPGLALICLYLFALAMVIILGVVGGGRLLVGGREGFSGLQRPSFGVKCHDYLLRGVPRVLA